MLVYFDTNVFDNLVKRTGGVIEADELRLRDAISESQIVVLASHVNLRETIAAFRSSPDLAKAQFQMISTLVDWSRIVRFHSSLLEDDIRQFAYSGERSSRIFETSSNIHSAVQLIIEGKKPIQELGPVIREDFEEKKEFLENVKKIRSETEAPLEELRKAGDIPTFQEWFADAAVANLTSFVESFDVRGRM